MVNVVLNDTLFVVRHISDHWDIVDLLVVGRVQVEGVGRGRLGEFHRRNRGSLRGSLVGGLVLSHVVHDALLCLLGRDGVHGVRSFEAFALGVLPVQHLVEDVAFLGSGHLS